VKNCDANDNIIYNPRECNRGRYKYFVGFYMIKKINNNSLMCVCKIKIKIKGDYNYV